MKIATTQKSASHREAIETLQPDRKMSVREAANFLRLSKSFLDKRRLDGTGPEYLKLGRRVVYDARDLESWASNTKRRHTSSAA